MAAYLNETDLISEGWEPVSVIMNDITFQRFGFIKGNYCLILDLTNPTHPFIELMVRDPSYRFRYTNFPPEHLRIVLECPNLDGFRSMESMLPKFNEVIFARRPSLIDSHIPFVLPEPGKSYADGKDFDIDSSNIKIVRRPHE